MTKWNADLLIFYLSSVTFNDSFVNFQIDLEMVKCWIWKLWSGTILIQQDNLPGFGQGEEIIVDIFHKEACKLNRENFDWASSEYYLFVLWRILPSSAPEPAKLGWVSLTVDFSSSPPVRPSGRTSSEIARNQLNLLCNICRFTWVQPKTIF